MTDVSALEPNTKPIKMGDLVGAWDAFERKVNVYGVVVEARGNSVKIKCPTCTGHAWKEKSMVWTLPA